MTYSKDSCFTPDCIKIVNFIADINELAEKLDRPYKLFFSPLQISLALGKDSSSGVRKYTSLLCKRGYLSRYKKLKNGDRSTTLYTMSVSQYNDWHRDESHYVRFSGNQYGVKPRK